MYQNPSGGLNEAGRKYFKRTEGSNLKAPVKSGVNPRRVSFAALLSKSGKPTRLKLALKAWGFSNKEEARAFANKNKKS